MQMVPVSLQNQQLPIPQQYSVQPVLVTPGFSPFYPGNMPHHDCHHKEVCCCKKRKKKNKEKSDSESDAESECYYVHAPGHHHSHCDTKKVIKIYEPSKPPAVNHYVQNYNCGKPGSDYMKALQQYKEASAQYNVDMDQYYYGNGANFVDPYYDPYFDPYYDPYYDPYFDRPYDPAFGFYP